MKPTPASTEDLLTIERALADVRSARANLRRAGARHAADAVARAAKSVEGALRHEYRRRLAAQAPPPVTEAPPHGFGAMPDEPYQRPATAFLVRLTMTETATLHISARDREEAVDKARATKDVDFDVEGCEYTAVEVEKCNS